MLPTHAAGETHCLGGFRHKQNFVRKLEKNLFGNEQTYLLGYNVHTGKQGVSKLLVQNSGLISQNQNKEKTSYQHTLHSNIHFIHTNTSYQHTIHTNTLHTNKHIIPTYTSYQHTSAMIQFSAHNPTTYWPSDFHHWGYLKTLEYWALIENEEPHHQRIFYVCRTIRNNPGTFEILRQATIRVSMCALIMVEDIWATWGRKQMQLPKRCVWTATRLHRV